MTVRSAPRRDTFTVRELRDDELQEVSGGVAKARTVKY